MDIIYGEVQMKQLHNKRYRQILKIAKMNINNLEILRSCQRYYNKGIHVNPRLVRGEYKIGFMIFDEEENE